MVWATRITKRPHQRQGAQRPRNQRPGA